MKGIRIESIDGNTYSAPDSNGIVEALRRKAWGGTESAGLRGYMKQVAKRIFDWNNARIRISGCRVFLQDLARHGIIRVLADTNGELKS